MISAQIKENRSRLDGLQLLAVAGLIVVGTLFVYSATMVGDQIGFWQNIAETAFVDFLRWLHAQLSSSN